MTAPIPWRQLFRRARESGPQFILSYLGMLRRHRLPPERIHRFQEQRLERILRHALQQVPAYRGAPALQGDSLRALEQFPLLDRSALLERWEQYVARNARRYSPKLVRTGGTTGKPVSLYLDGSTRALWNMMVLLRRQWAGWRPADRSVFFGHSYGGLPGSIGAANMCVLDRSMKELLLNGMGFDDRCLQEFARTVVEFRPHILRGSPLHLVLLARTINSVRARVRLRAILTGGELLSDEQRRYLEETFACKVYDWYNMWENVATAVQCEEGSYHLIPELSSVEILRNGRPCQPGEVGEIVGTHLGNFSMPLIRYHMNDLASPTGSSCPCDRNSQTLTIIGGRGRDILVTPRGYAVLGNISIAAKIDPHPPVEKLQFYQERNDEVLVRIVRGDGYTEDDTRRLVAELDTILGGTMKIGWEYVEDIPRAPSGKYPYVVSHVPLEL